MRTLLLDADIIAYKCASANEERFEWSDGTTTSIDESAAKQMMKDTVEMYMDTLDGDHVIICLSDDFQNFRKKLNPSYKDNRKTAYRPEMLYDLKDIIADMYDHKVIPTLEGDDVMGILHTDPDKPNETVMVSEDKDMRTVPGLLYHPHRPEQGIMDVSELDATRFLLWQTVVGDPTDGYPGAKGVGKSNTWVEGILESEDPLEMWDHALCAYFTKGLTEQDAILQARMARILRHSDYDAKNRRVRNWTPASLLHS